MTVREALAQENPGALLYPERYDDALMGWTSGFGPRLDTRAVAVYDRGKLAEILATEFAEDAKGDGDDSDESDLLSEAEQWIDYNMAGAYLGPDGPMIVAMADSF